MQTAGSLQDILLTSNPLGYFHANNYWSQENLLREHNALRNFQQELYDNTHALSRNFHFVYVYKALFGVFGASSNSE